MKSRATKMATRCGALKSKSMKKYNKKSVLICDYCQKEFSRSSDLKRHVKVHTGQKDHHCNLCDFACCHKGDLTVHIRRHLNERPFKCTEISCGAAFVSSGDLKSHQNVHNKNNKQFACPICPFKTGAQSCFIIHVQNSHSISHRNGNSRKKKGFLCTSCPFKTHSQDCLRSHMKSVHSELKPFKCPYESCKFSAKRKDHINQHSKIHSKKSNQVCPSPNCDFKTKWTTALKRHMGIHLNGEKRHKCHFCDYSCRRHGDLVVHVRLHTGETPFACPLCSYKSRNKIMLSRHMQKHED